MIRATQFLAWPGRELSLCNTTSLRGVAVVPLRLAIVVGAGDRIACNSDNAFRISPEGDEGAASIEGFRYLTVPAGCGANCQCSLACLFFGGIVGSDTARTLRNSIIVEPHPDGDSPPTDVSAVRQSGLRSKDQ